MSVTRLPCTLISAFAWNRTMTPPSVAPKEERVAIQQLTWHSRLLDLTVDGMAYIRAVYWAVSVAEIATIIAGLAPPSQVPGTVISFLLIVRGEARDIRMTPLSTIGMVTLVIGTLLRVWCFRTLKEFFTFDHTIRKGHKLVTVGPYRIVRHPAYSSLLIAYIGMFCWFGSQGSWLRESGVLDTTAGMLFFGAFTAMMVGLYIGLVARMKREDVSLREEFKEEWDRWAQQVPYSLVPLVY